MIIKKLNYVIMMMMSWLCHLWSSHAHGKQQKINCIRVLHVFYCYRLALLTEAAILEVSGQSSLTDIKTLDLHGNSLTRFVHMGTQLAHLNMLVLCFNELSQLDEVSHLVWYYH